MFKNSFSALGLACLLVASAFAQTGQPLQANPSSAAVAEMAGGRVNRQITTIDDLVRTGQLRRTHKETTKVSPPPPQTTGGAAAPQVPRTGFSASAHTAPGAHLESGLQLLTTFNAVGLRRAQLRVSGNDILVDMGDRIKGGWLVSDIAAVSVHLKRCIKNQCDEKILHLGED